MTFKNTERQIRKDFKYSLKDSIFWSFMNSIALTFLVPFVISLGANSFQVGLLSSLPIFIGSFFSLLSYQVLRHFDSKKQAVVFFVTLQAFLWLPLSVLYIYFNNQVTIWLSILFYIIIHTLGIVVHPVYMDWIRRIFPVERIGSLFARKNLIIELFAFIPLIFSGYLLNVLESYSEAFIGFTLIFMFAGLSRFISGRYLNKMSLAQTKKELKEELDNFPKRDLAFVKKEIFKDKVFLKYLIFVVIFYFGFYIGSYYLPYFYLTSLKMNYSHYIWWKIAYILGGILSLFYWGVINDKYGNVKIFRACSLFVPLFVLLPALFYNYYWILILTSFFSGVVLSGFNLSIINYLYRNIKEDLMDHSAYFTIVQSTAIFLGTLFGSFLISFFEKISINEKNALILVLIISAFFRLIAYFFARRIKDPNPKKINIYKKIIFQRPVVYSLKHFFFYLSSEEKKLLKQYRKKHKKHKNNKINKMIDDIKFSEKQIVDKLVSEINFKKKKRKKANQKKH